MSKPIPYSFLRTPDGKTYSRFSSLVKGAELVTEGWTVEHPDGTQGIGRKPFDTEADAQAWCDANPHFPGMNQG